MLLSASMIWVRNTDISINHYFLSCCIVSCCIVFNFIVFNILLILFYFVSFCFVLFRFVSFCFINFILFCFNYLFLGNSGYGLLCTNGDEELSLSLETRNLPCPLTNTILLPIIIDPQKQNLEIIVPLKRYVRTKPSFF